jgi:hypothetical protein
MAATFGFRPWVRRAGLSIVLVACAATPALAWVGERALWVYIITLMIGGLKVWLGTLRPIAEVSDDALVIRPLHNLRERVIAWTAISGTEQMVGGDRLMVFYETRRGLRFAAVNLNLVKGRREFLALIDNRLSAMGFVEKHAGRSRYLSRLDAHQRSADEGERDRK